MKKIIEERIKDSSQRRINTMLDIVLIECSYETRTATMVFGVHDWMLNSTNVLHGGILMTFFDIAMGLLAVGLNGDVSTPTANLSVNFVRPVPLGEQVTIEARCPHSGRTMIQTSASAYSSARGAECAYATAIFSKSTPSTLNVSET